MRKLLVGHTGFVGSNLAAQTDFDGLYNSKNIEEAYGQGGDVLVYSGLRAEKFLANRRPDLDHDMIEQAERNIERIGCACTVFISTVDVYPDPRGVDETTPIDASELAPYGANRLEMEGWLARSCPRHLIVRLPALFGKNLKKNFLYDLTHPVPGMLSDDLHARLGAAEPLIERGYAQNEYGFWQLVPGAKKDGALTEAFARAGFDSKSFTDSRSRFQFFNLAHLWGLIERALDEGIELLNVTSEPVSAAEVYAHVYGGEFVNEVAARPFDYDMRTVHAEALGGSDGYLYDRQTVLAEIADFLRGGAR